MLICLLAAALSVVPHFHTVITETDSIQRDDSLQSSSLLLLPFEREILAASRAEQIPAALLAAIVQEESRFEEWAGRVEPHYLEKLAVRRAAAEWSRKHGGIPTAATELQDRARSYGLTQIMGETVRNLGFAERYLARLYDPAQSLRIGARILREDLNRYHRDTLAAISAYNQGSARLRGSIFANARYVYRVSIAMEAYRRYFNRTR